jgi:hypothetical protein
MGPVTQLQQQDGAGFGDQLSSKIQSLAVHSKLKHLLINS